MELSKMDLGHFKYNYLISCLPTFILYLSTSKKNEDIELEYWELKKKAPSYVCIILAFWN